MKKKDIAMIVLRCCVALTLFVLAIIYYDELSGIDLRKLADFTDNIYIMAGITLVVYLIKSLVFVVPASVIYVAVGAIMPTPFALLVNLLGIFIEVSVTYLLGRFLGEEAVKNLLSKSEGGRKVLEKDLQSNTKVLLTIRAVPAFPIDFISLFYGASGCNYLRYAVLSVVGISWRVILFTILGDAVFGWIPMDKIVLLAICCIPVGVIYYLVKKFVIEPKKNKAYK